MSIKSKNFDTFVSQASENYAETYAAIRASRENQGGFAETQIDVEEKGRFGYISVRAYAEVTNIRVTYQCAQEYAEAIISPDGKIERVF